MRAKNQEQIFYSYPTKYSIARGNSTRHIWNGEKPEVKKKGFGQDNYSKIVRVVPHHEGFHFFRGLRDSTGKVAISLTDFVEKMRRVDIRSANFHFKRQDFAKWVRDTIGDSDLSMRISRIRKETHEEKLRNEIIQIVKSRLAELKETQTKA